MIYDTTFYDADRNGRLWLVETVHGQRFYRHRTNAVTYAKRHVDATLYHRELRGFKYVWRRKSI